MDVPNNDGVISDVGMPSRHLAGMHPDVILQQLHKMLAKE